MVLFVFVFCSVCVCNFNICFDEIYVLVGIVKDLILNFCLCVGGFIYVYKIIELIDGGYKLEFVYKVSNYILSSEVLEL